VSQPTACLIDDVVSWRHDLVGCLWTSAATILAFHGAEVLPTLGAAWGFRHQPDDLRREEYYYPCAPGVSRYEAIAPYHPVRSRWHEPADAEQGWIQVRDMVLSGQPVVVAADNFYLPFRPAYQDVHTNHLVVLYGFETERGTATVLDAVPPKFNGEITIAEFTAARDSGNPQLHDRDMFFTDNPLGNRWLEIEVDTAAFPPFDRDTIKHMIRRNLDGFAASPDGGGNGGYWGMAGQGAYLDDLADRLEGGQNIRDELFLVAGAVLANTALHADWLALAAGAVGIPALAEAGRDVERIAHHRTAIRIMSALTPAGEVSPVRLRRRFSALLSDQARVLARLDDLVTDLG
jgi:hypothetical protein